MEKSAMLSCHRALKHKKMWGQSVAKAVFSHEMPKIICWEKITVKLYVSRDDYMYINNLQSPFKGPRKN